MIPQAWWAKMHERGMWHLARKRDGIKMVCGRTMCGKRLIFAAVLCEIIAPRGVTCKQCIKWISKEARP